MIALSFGLDMREGYLYVAEQYDQHFFVVEHYRLRFFRVL